MKKLIPVFFAVAVTTSLLIGCSGFKPAFVLNPDGTYSFGGTGSLVEPTK